LLNKQSRVLGGRKFARIGLWAILSVVLVSNSLRAETGFSGMYLQGINERIAQTLGLKETIGVLIRDLAVGEPASLAGLERGDLIVSYDGQDIATFKQLVKVARATKPGQKIEVGVLRRGRSKTFVMKLGKRSGAWKVARGEVATIPEVGLTLASMTPKIRQRFDVRWGALGVLVTLIDPALEKKMPVSRGDIIVQVDQRAVWSPKQIETRYKQAQKDGRESVLILIERLGEFKFLLLPVKKKP
jgi:serine protease Do